MNRAVGDDSFRSKLDEFRLKHIGRPHRGGSRVHRDWLKRSDRRPRPYHPADRTTRSISRIVAQILGVRRIAS